MKITRIERTIVCVPFLPGILSPPEFEEFTPSYPQPLSQRRQDVLRVRTDAGLTGIGMSPPYFGEREDGPLDLIGKDLLSFEPRSLGGGEYAIALLDLIDQAIEWPLCRIFGGRLQEKVLIDYWITRMGPEDSAAAAQRAPSRVPGRSHSFHRHRSGARLARQPELVLLISHLVGGVPIAYI